MTPTRTYPQGVPSWIDTEQPDPEAAQDFYRRLFGWTFETVSPPDAPLYAIATHDGRDVAGLSLTDPGAAAWNTYIAVDDADATAARVAGAGGQVPTAPVRPWPGRTHGVLHRSGRGGVPPMAGRQAAGSAGGQRAGQLELQ